MTLEPGSRVSWALPVYEKKSTNPCQQENQTLNIDEDDDDEELRIPCLFWIHYSKAVGWQS